MCAIFVIETIKNDDIFGTPNTDGQRCIRHRWFCACADWPGRRASKKDPLAPADFRTCLRRWGWGEEKSVQCKRVTRSICQGSEWDSVNVSVVLSGQNEKNVFCRARFFEDFVSFHLFWTCVRLVALPTLFTFTYPQLL